MPALSHVFAVELRSPVSGAPLARASLDPSDLEPLIVEATWEAQRRGCVGPDPAQAVCRVLPVFSEAGGCRIRALRVLVGPLGAVRGQRAPRRFSTSYAVTALERGLRRLAPKLLPSLASAAGEKLDIAVTARPRSPSRAERPGVVTRTPALWLPGRLAAWLACSSPLGPTSRPGARSPAPGARPSSRRGAPPPAPAHPVFLSRRAFEKARGACLDASPNEGAAFLVGRILREEGERPELFVVADEAFRARYAREEPFSIDFTAATWSDLQERLARRRRRPGHAGDVLVAVAHCHPFPPALDRQARSLCTSCSRRPTCGRHSSHLSEADHRLLASLLARSPWGFAVLWGLDPRGGEVARFFGLRAGSFEERSVCLFDTPPLSETR